MQFLYLIFALCCIVTIFGCSSKPKNVEMLSHNQCYILNTSLVNTNGVIANYAGFKDISPGPLETVAYLQHCPNNRFVLKYKGQIPLGIDFTKHDEQTPVRFVTLRHTGFGASMTLDGKANASFNILDDASFEISLITDDKIHRKVISRPDGDLQVLDQQNGVTISEFSKKVDYGVRSISNREQDDIEYLVLQTDTSDELIRSFSFRGEDGSYKKIRFSFGQGVFKILSKLPQASNLEITQVDGQLHVSYINYLNEKVTVMIHPNGDVFKQVYK